MKKKLVALTASSLIIGVGLGYKAHNPPTKVVTQTKAYTVTKTVPAVAPVYHVGDTQDGVTLVGAYPYSYQNMMGGNGPTPPTVNLVYFAVSGVDKLASNTQVLSVDGTYLSTDGPAAIPACGNDPCIGYISSSQPVTFYYRDLKWSL